MFCISTVVMLKLGIRGRVCIPVVGVTGFCVMPMSVAFLLCAFHNKPFTSLSRAGDMLLCSSTHSRCHFCMTDF